MFVAGCRMRDVLVVCEGQTEREFCRSVIAPYIATSGVALAGTLVGKPQRKRGGIRDWPVYRNELLRLGKERADRHLAVLVDFYAMPASWPGRQQSSARPIAQRGRYVEDALVTDLSNELDGRFHPCVQLHEYESLLFVEPDLSALSLAVGGGVPNHSHVAEQLAEIREEFNGRVEEIDDSPETAPSKRVIKVVPGYDKVAWGVMAAADVEVDVLREGCPWLDRWLTQLESLAKED